MIKNCKRTLHILRPIELFRPLRFLSLLRFSFIAPYFTFTPVAHFYTAVRWSNLAWVSYKIFFLKGSRRFPEKNEVTASEDADAIFRPQKRPWTIRRLLNWSTSCSIDFENYRHKIINLVIHWLLNSSPVQLINFLINQLFSSSNSSFHRPINSSTIKFINYDKKKLFSGC